MSDIVTSKRDIPDARFYVLATDSFMSGWGGAQGRDNVLVIPCDTLRTAEAIEAILRGKSEMRRVRTTGAKPAPRPSWLLQAKTSEDVLQWKTDADFARERAAEDSEVQS